MGEEPVEPGLDPYEARPFRGFFVALLMVCVFFVVGSIGVMLNGWSSEELARLFGLFPPAVWGALGAAYFSIAGLNLARLIKDPRPTLQITEEGILNRTYSSSVGLVPWEDVIEVRKTMVPGILEIVLRDPASFRDRQPRLSRIIMRITSWVGLGVFPIHLWQLNASHAEVTQRLDDALQEIELAPVRDQRLLDG